jgi:hypothetical protein
MPTDRPSAWVRHRVFGHVRNRGIVLLAALVLQLVMYPLFERPDAPTTPWIVAYWLATPLLGVVQLASRWWTIAVAGLCALMIAIAAVLAQTEMIAIPGTVLVVFGVVVYLAAAFAIGRAALFSEELLDNRLYAGISAYLLVGYCFAGLHHLVWNYDPSAYQNASHPGPSNLHIADFIYFSFSTLTTAGFGDIVAVSRGARLTCMLEAVTGILMPATFIARLLSQQK